MEFSDVFQGPAGNYTVTYSVDDNKDGTYTVLFGAPLAGQYIVNITNNGVPIFGTPYSVTLKGGKFSPIGSVASGAGLQGAQGKNNNFIIHE